MVAGAMVFALETHQKVELAIMAAVFIGFALVSSFVLPARSPNFPGKHLRWYLVVCVCLFVAMISTIIFIAREPATAAAAKGNENAGAQTTPTVPSKPAPPPSGNAAAGKAVFASAGCGACHTYTPAGSTGTVGPSLDDLAASAQKANRGTTDQYVHESIVSPNAYITPGYAPSIMPQTFGTTLKPQQIDDLVAFLTQGH
jgi:mono/diheme cytochrome c family protein